MSIRESGQRNIPDVRVVIVNYNAGAHLARCVQALLSQSLSNFEIVLIDNGSVDGSLDALPADIRLSISRTGQNLGFATGNNLGLEGVRAPLIALLNPDAIPSPDWLERLIAAAARHSDYAMFGSLQLCDHDPSRIDGAGDTLHIAGTAWREGRLRPAATVLGTRYDIFGPCAAAALVRTVWMMRVGGFDQRFFCYFEDVDLAFRIRLLGGRAMQINDAVVRHVGSATTGAGSDFVVYHSVRNQIWTIVKCMPGPLLAIALPMHVAIVAVKGLLAIPTGRAAAHWRAVRDGIKGLPSIIASRRELQRERKAGAMEIARALSWSLAALWHRADRSVVATAVRTRSSDAR